MWLVTCVFLLEPCCSALLLFVFSLPLSVMFFVYLFREVKESALSGPADRSSTELMEVEVDQPGAQGQADTRAEPESSEELSDKVRIYPSNGTSLLMG